MKLGDLVRTYDTFSHAYLMDTNDDDVYSLSDKLGRIVGIVIEMRTPPRSFDPCARARVLWSDTSIPFVWQHTQHLHVIGESNDDEMSHKV